MQGALEWLEKNQDRSLEDIQAEDASKGGEDAKDAPMAKSMVCNECGKKLRTMNAVEFHAEKTYVIGADS